MVKVDAYTLQYIITIYYNFSQEMEIKKMANAGNNEACKILAKQLVQLRKQKTRVFSANSKVCLT